MVAGRPVGRVCVTVQVTCRLRAPRRPRRARDLSTRALQPDRQRTERLSSSGRLAPVDRGRQGGGDGRRSPCLPASAGKHLLGARFWWTSWLEKRSALHDGSTSPRAGSAANGGGAAPTSLLLDRMPCRQTTSLTLIDGARIRSAAGGTAGPDRACGSTELRRRNGSDRRLAGDHGLAVLRSAPGARKAERGDSSGGRQRAERGRSRWVVKRRTSAPRARRFVQAKRAPVACAWSVAATRLTRPCPAVASLPNLTRGRRGSPAVPRAAGPGRPRRQR